ncbi:hypothetical protein B484DRAFT_415567, partial [Ochromonadaceae sp. CCMP2298]
MRVSQEQRPGGGGALERPCPASPSSPASPSCPSCPSCPSFPSPTLRSLHTTAPTPAKAAVAVSHARTQLLPLMWLLLCWVPAVAAKCLIVSIDNRPLSDSLYDNSYPAMTAVLNLAYAKHHGYDFLYVQNTIESLEAQTRARFPDADIVPPTDNAKDAATAFHVGLKQFRAASWAKLPALWHVTTTVGAQYEYIWYIDSDAAVSPLQRHLSIEANIQRWEEHGMVIRGNKQVSQSQFVFFHNHPWRDDMPCAGSFIYRPGAESVLREWWDYDMPIKNFKHFHEQDALWHMIEAEGDKGWREQHKQAPFQLNTSTYSVLSERQFPSAWQRYEGLWLTHIASYNYLLRMPVLYHFLKVLGLDAPHRFAAQVREILSSHVMQVSLLDVAVSMQAASAKDRSRVTHFPRHDTATELAWYDQHVTSKTQQPLPPAALHEGRLVRRKGEFWVVSNGTKRGFQSYDVFLKLGLYNDLGMQLSPHELEQIPTGATLGQAEVLSGLGSLSPAYATLPSKTKSDGQGQGQGQGQGSVQVDVSEIRERMALRKQMRHSHSTRQHNNASAGGLSGGSSSSSSSSGGSGGGGGGSGGG